ncbi:hypothetical protein J6590_033058 [Homalodisca vitripennis]|nr:hypothetical protein J6590_033058 [Homalodisca vitripennis]
MYKTSPKQSHGPNQCCAVPCEDLTVNYCGVSSVSFVVAKGEGNARTCEKVEETDTHLDVLHPLVRSYRGVVVEPGVHTYDFSLQLLHLLTSLYKSPYGQIIYNVNVHLITSEGNSTNGVVVEPGVHTYDFSLQLPHLLPSSYKSPYGHISYYVSVHLITSEGTSDVRKPYVVRAPVNINLFLSGQNPKCAEITQKYGLIRNRSLRLKASVTKTCFVPGDIISVFIEALNETDRDLRYLFCTLKQITHVLVQLQDETVSRVTKQCLTTLAHKTTKGRRYHSWLCKLPSPTFLTPTIAASTIVFVTYSLQVSARLKRVPIPPDIQIPIVFGVRVPTSPQCSPQPSDTKFVRRVSRQHIPGVHCPIQRRNNLISSVAKMIRQGDRQLPTATNPRRRVSVFTQPRIIFPNIPRRGSCQLTLNGVSLTREDSNDSLVSGIGTREIPVSHFEDDFSIHTGKTCDELNATNLMEDNESLPITDSLRRQSMTTNDLVQNIFTDFKTTENEESLTDLSSMSSDDDDSETSPPAINLRSLTDTNNQFEDSFSDFLRTGSYQSHPNVAKLIREDSDNSLPTVTKLRRRPIIVSNLRRGSCQLRSRTSDLPTSDSSATNMRRNPFTVSIPRRGSCQPHFSSQDSEDNTNCEDNSNSSPNTDSGQHRPLRRISCQLQFSVTNVVREDRSETPPTATNPRRRITISTQPQFNFTPPPSRVNQLQSIASSLTQRLTNQLQALMPSR